ncbi:LTA synthase family protein [Mangrovibacter phragmitis]|uniref:LTA synthase family protein n=1 Tax=Mangrovibacter phragmitis TaxID=1691903 RepID=UPI00336A3184
MSKTILSFIHKKIINTKINASVLDCFFSLLILYISTKTLVPSHDIILNKNFPDAVIKFLWLSSPLLFFYFTLRACKLPIFLCFYFVCLVIILLSFANNTKMSLTDQPLSYNDIVSTVNITVAYRYISFKLLIVGVFSVLGGMALVPLSKIVIDTRSNYIFIIFLLLMIFPYSFSPYAEEIFGEGNGFANFIQDQARKRDVVYFSWDPVGNVKDHGLAMHLIQTSVRKSVPKVTDDERNAYLNIKKNNSSQPVNYKTIVYILCESCWYDESHFKDIFKPLLSNGYTGFRSISPVYGAGTANSEFEMLTGLPSNSNVLSGIIYQEYSDAIKDNSDSLASSLKLKGFNTYAAHNNSKTFWRRNVIYKKFGFEQFDGFSDMGSLPQVYARNKKPWQWQADDYLLYNSALQKIKESHADGKNIFLNLITMSTHGPYMHINDSGEGVYSYELNEAIERLTQFTKELEKIDPDAVIVIYGDHKPALNKYFYENGVFPSSFFTKTGLKDEDFEFKSGLLPKEYGDVPVLIKSSDKKKVEKVVTEAKNKPFFCTTAFIDKNFIHSGLVAFNYNLEHFCKEKDNVYDKKSVITPSWIYSMALFEN